MSAISSNTANKKRYHGFEKHFVALHGYKIVTCDFEQ
jgi:hypothetical protein